MDGHRSSNSPEIDGPSCFRCIIILDVLTNNRLPLPKNFVTKHGENLSAFATLNVVADGPNGNVWKLGLHHFMEGIKVDEDKTEIRRKITIGNGLDVFLKHYSISLNDELIFIYKGESDFDVRIIENGTACEKLYEKNLNLQMKIQSSESKEQEQRKRKKDLSSFDTPKRPKKIKDEEDSGSHSSVKSAGNFEFLKLQREFPHMYVSRRFSGYVTSEARTKAISFTRTIKPQRPFFLNILRNYNISEGTMLIATEFSKKYLIGVEDVRFVISNNEDREWLVSIHRTARGVCFYEGWNRFVKQNGFAEGDIMIYEIISEDNAPIVIKVSVDHIVVE